MFTFSSLFSHALQLILTFRDPTVSLGTATVTGVNDNSGITQSFLGIPFAAAPRFDLPQPIKAYTGEIDATKYGPVCIQQDIMTTATLTMKVILKQLKLPLPVPKPESEECLSINIIRPATATPSSQLPVAAMIYGGGFLFGDSQTWDGMGKAMVEKSVANGEDVIFVSFNYRVSAYGFLAGKEVRDDGVGNVGLRDQREALRWVQRYIRYFGGDPGRVIIWGQSAGAMSASLQMLAHEGDNAGLFHGVFAQSGAPLPVGDIENGQDSFDLIAEATGCDREADKLNCLRNIDLDRLRYAVNATDSFFSKKSLVLTWAPRADGEFLTENPYRLVERGRVADVPIVTGNVDDEGTLFSLAVLYLMFPIQFKAWIRNVWAPKITMAELRELVEHYPNIPREGSPFDTGKNNTLTGEYKRISAFQGDMVFQAPRRFFTQELSKAGRDNVWVYLSKQFKEKEPLGSSHGSDVAVLDNYYLMTEHVAKFTKYLNPNIGGDVPVWPIYNHDDPQLYLFPAGDGSGNFPDPEVHPDNHREAGFTFLTELAHKYPL